MAYEVFARKWRPQVFDDVIGQGHITRTLVNAIKNERLAHAYLFSGSRGVGKTSVARILAKALNCKEGTPGIPCNKCQSCLEITNGSSVDVQEIDGASNRGIDEIRELRENIRYMPSSSRFRAYIIDEVHMLTKEAFNALLKTLEEPPEHVKFIFATTEPHKVPVTILSRCQRFDFKRIPVNQIVSQLEKIVGDEGIEISQFGLSIIAGKAEGSMRDAESLLDQVISFTGARVEEKDITDILGIIDRNLIFQASEAIISGVPEKCIEIVDQIYNNGYDLKEFYRVLMDQFRNLMISLIVPGNELLDMTESDREETRQQAENAGLERLQQSLNILIAREEGLRYSLQPRLVLETIMIKLSRIGEVLSFEELIKKIEALEKRLTNDTLSNNFSPNSVSSEGRLSNQHVASRQDQLSDPGRAWEKGKKTEKSGLPEEIEEKGWDEFLKFLSSKKSAMANILKNWRFISLNQGRLEIERGGNAFSFSYLDDPERLDKFISICKDFFKRDINIKIKNGKNSAPKKRKVSDPNNSEPIIRDQKDLPDSVKDVIDMFDGEIKEEIINSE